MTDIITLGPDDRVTEPGAFKMPMSVYHSQCAPGVSVSSTGIRKAALQSPLAFWKTWDQNPDRYPPKEESDALILGKAAHCLILGDEVFAENFAYVPEDAPKRPTKPQIEAFERNGGWSDAAREGGIWWTQFDAENAGKALLTAEKVQIVGYMAENLAALPEARQALIGGLTEISMIWQDEETGLWVKSRPDCIPDHTVDFGDLKTHAPRGDMMQSALRAVSDNGYAIQMAMACEGSEIVFGATASMCALIFTMTTAPYEPVPIMLDEEALGWGRVMYRIGLNRIAQGLKTGNWPGRATGFVNYRIPPFLAERVNEGIAA